MKYHLYDSDLNYLETYLERERAEERAMEFSKARQFNDDGEELRYSVQFELPLMNKWPELRVLSFYFDGTEEYRTDRYDQDISEILQLEAAQT